MAAERGVTLSPTSPPSPRGSKAAAPGSSMDGQEGSRHDMDQRSLGLKYIPPPARGMQHEQSLSRQLNSATEIFHPLPAESMGFGPRIDLPKFDRSNPKLWQTHYEDYFRLWNTPPHQWIPFVSALFEGTTAHWLESVQRRAPNVSWCEFCELLQSRFGHNKHQNLLRQMFHIRQTSTLEEYVEHFSELYDQLTTYETNPNPVHYATRFMEGLIPSVRLIVGIRQPEDLDSALLSEELGDTSMRL